MSKKRNIKEIIKELMNTPESIMFRKLCKLRDELDELDRARIFPNLTLKEYQEMLHQQSDFQYSTKFEDIKGGFSMTITPFITNKN